MRAVRAAALSLVVAGMLAGGGCYKPNILQGTLQCSIPDDKCPDDWTCDKSNPQLHLCVRSGGGGRGGATGGTQGTGGKGGSGKGGNGTGGTAGAGGTGGKVGTGGAAGAACLAKVSNCTTTFAGGACDPVCNVGCATCDEKCSVSSTGSLTCNPLYPLASTGGHDFDFCDPYLPPTDHTKDSDDCGPGLACVNQNACGPRCYRFCRTDDDCPSGSRCSIGAGAGQSFCDAPVVACDPVQGVQGMAQSGCLPVNIKSCYLSDEFGTTSCDCYNNSTGFKVGTKCEHSRDCFGGLVCTSFTGVGSKYCRKVCRLPAMDGSDLTNRDAGEGECSSLSNCVPILLPDGTYAKTFGACNE